MDAVDDVFNGIGQKADPPSEPAAGDGASVALPGVADSPPVRVTVERLAPTCAGNTWSDSGTLCTGALTLCAVEGEIAFWVWRQVIEVGTAPDPNAWRRVSGFRCIGPSDPVVDPRVAIAGIVQREFSSYDIFRGSVVVDPEGETLVGFPTRFWTDAREYEFTRSILGRRVVITARPVEFVFHFGDGQVARRSVAPRPETADLVHDYAGPGSEQAYVVVTWEGSYVIEGSPQVLQVRGTATTTGVSTRVLVREARSQYEGG
ncbi:MAG: hypothetical protein Q8R60_16075 [Mycobacteriales bacterium]|nr:hypothetical protein [Mycobacteriales bacterium]